MHSLNIQQTLERLASLLRGESRNQLSEYGLLPVQFEALNYLSISNRYSNSPKAVTEFLGQTKGTVSQTLKVLEKKGLICKQTDSFDKRVVHLKITRTGTQLVNKLRPSPFLDYTCQQLSETELADVNFTLTNLLNQLQTANQFKTFGQCHSCLYNIKVDESHFLCGLTREPLSTAETKLICREHLPAHQ